MSDIRRWQRRARALFGGAIAVALLWPCVSLVRETTAHDWYAAVKLTVTEAMIAAGSNSYKPTRYRAPDGTSYPITRGGLVLYGEPIEARDRILYTAAVGVLHGGFAGAIWVVLWVMLWRAVNGWRNRREGRPPGRGPSEPIESRDPSDIAEVLPASEAARLIGTLGAVGNPQSVPAQQSVERANTPLLPAADTAGATPKSAGTPAQPAKAKAGGGDQPRASSEPPAPDSEDELPEPDDGGKLNWI